jgi:DNA-binding transcriptional MerR regulator
MSRPILRVQEAAEAIGVSVQTIRRYERAGVLPSPPRDRNSWRAYSPEHVESMRKTIFPESSFGDS